MPNDSTFTLREGEWILLVEDSESDVLLLRFALPGCDAANQIRWVNNGEKAVQLLTDLACSTEALPDTVLLDLNLPRVDGFSVLAFIRSLPALRSVAVLVYSSSQFQSEKRRALAGGADGYLPKPSDLAGYQALAGAIEEARRHRAQRMTTPEIALS